MCEHVVEPIQIRPDVVQILKYGKPHSLVSGESIPPGLYGARPAVE